MGVAKMKDITFDEYKSWLEKYEKNNDIREINIQNEIVKRFITNICTDLDIVYSDKKGPNTSNHDYFQYCGTYTDKNGKEKAVTPDLVIAKNWNWLNIENKVDYRAVVEVKSPFLKQRIYNKHYNEYGENLKDELRRHLSAKNNNKVILTDALKWEFYIKSEQAIELIPLRTFKLYDLSSGMGKYKNGEQYDTIKTHLNHTELVEEFKELKHFLIEFLSKGN